MALTDQQHQYLVMAVEEMIETYKFSGGNSTAEEMINEAAVVMAEGFLKLIDISSKLELQPGIDWSKLEMPNDWLDDKYEQPKTGASDD